VDLLLIKILKSLTIWCHMKLVSRIHYPLHIINIA